MLSIRRFIISIFLILPFYLSAQSTFIKGVVIDKYEREPLAFCNVYVPQLREGFITDENGEFEKTLVGKFDSVTFSYLGYDSYVLKFPVANPEDITIELKSASKELEQITVYAPRKRQKDTTAWRIYSNVVANKPINRPTAHSSLEYEEYSKIIGSFYNFSPKLLDRKIIRPFRFVLENYDTTADGRKYIPLILKEEITHHYLQKDPKENKSVVLSSKVSGIEQAQISNLLNVALDEMDAYSNELIISQKSFMMPFAEGAWFKYRFYVIDSTENDRCEWIYHIGFAPNIKGELAFLGEAWIHEPTYAIQRIELKIEKNANINWVNDFYAVQEFARFDDKHWLKIRDQRTTGVSITQRKKSKMVHIEQIKLFDKFKINEGIEDSIFADKKIFADGYRKRTDEYWTENRFEPLRPSHENVYFLIDSLKSTKAYKRYYNFGRTMATGYYKAGPIDIGNLYNMLSYNPTEGWRIRLSTRSNRFLHEKFRYNLYGAYGTNDKKFKYGINLYYRFVNDENLLQEFGAFYRDDYQRFSLTGSISNEYDYILNALLRKGEITDLVYVKDFLAYHKKEWNPIIATQLSVNFKKYQTIPGLLEFVGENPDGSRYLIDNFKLFSPNIRVDLSPGAKFLHADGKKFLIKGKLPIFILNYSFSKKGFGSDFNFHNLGLYVEQRLPNPIGWTRYLLSANKLFGEIPYPLLYIHQGNENFLKDYKRFSNMREGEYAADQEISLLLEHHFGGFFFNKIPGVRKLQMREIFIYKMALSSLDKSKTGDLLMPASLKGLDGFYAEIGFGIDNILKLLQVQCTWRLTQRDVPDVNKFAIKFWISPSF